MELYKFVKSLELQQSHTLHIHSSTLNETATQLEVSGGAYCNIFKSIISFGIKGSHRRLFKKLNAVDINHTIEGDQVPRIVYLVYKLSEARNIDLKAQRGIVDRLFYEKNYKKQHHYPRLHHPHYKSVDQQFMFFACIEQEGDKDWPNEFLVPEVLLDLSQLDENLEQWRCISKEKKIIVKNSNAFIKLNKVPTRPFNEEVMMYSYINSIRKIVCKSCTHSWTLVDYLDLMICKQIYEAHPTTAGSTSETFAGYQLQKRLGQCKLWIFYLPQNAFAAVSDDSCDNSSSNSFLGSFLKRLFPGSDNKIE